MHKQVGLIGIGLLGSAIADRLKESGLDVHGFDVVPTRRANVAHGRETPQDVFDACDVVVLSLPTSQIVQEALTSAQLRSDQLVIDTTTGEPDEMVDIAKQVGQHSAVYAEATVAGSSKQMRAGRATMFLGCDQESLKQVQSVTSLLSSKCFHLGGVGAASRFKLIHNLIIGLNRAVLAEGLTFAESLGFDSAQTLEILQQTPAVSGVMATKGRKMVDGDYETQAKLSQHLKDVRLILREASKRNAPSPLSEVHATLLEMCEQLGFGDRDNSAVIEAFRDKTR